VRPKSYRDPRTGEIRQRQVRVPASPDPGVVDASLRNAQGTSVFTRRGGDEPELQQLWAADGDGFRSTYHFEMDASPRIGPDYVDTPHWQSWSLTMEDVDQLNDTPRAEVRARVERLLDERVGDELDMYGPIPTGVLGETRETQRREAKILLAVRILGAAPLAPHVRAATFEWLAEQPGARLDGEAEDVIGRRGTSVRFEWIHDRRVPAYTTSTDELVDDARAAGADIESATPDRTWKVPAHRQYRRWLTTIVFDPDRGELLQSHHFSSSAVEGKVRIVPRLFRVHRDDRVQVRVDENLNGSGYQISAGAQLYRIRDRVTEIEPVSPICRTHPKVCRDSGGPLKAPH
jgi:hypothetical protein